MFLKGLFKDRGEDTVPDPHQCRITSSVYGDMLKHALLHHERKHPANLAGSIKIFLNPYIVELFDDNEAIGLLRRYLSESDNRLEVFMNNTPAFDPLDDRFLWLANKSQNIQIQHGSYDVNYAFALMGDAYCWRPVGMTYTQYVEPLADAKNEPGLVKLGHIWQQMWGSFSQPKPTLKIVQP